MQAYLLEYSNDSHHSLLRIQMGHSHNHDDNMQHLRHKILDSDHLFAHKEPNILALTFQYLHITNIKTIVPLVCLKYGWSRLIQFLEKD